jgi:hypothetical protein
MNSRLQEFENLITSPDGTIDDVFSKAQRENNEIAQLMTMNPQQAYQLSQDIKNQQDALDTGLKKMMNQFSESIQQVLKDKPDATKQAKYQNVLPYGLRPQPAGTNQQRPTLTQDVNEDLENLDHSLTKRLHSAYTNVYHRMFKDTYHELKEEMTENYGDSAVKDIDGECLNHIFSSAVGSMFDWTSIDPKSVGMGSIDHISELFQKYYYGEVNDNGPRPWEEIRSDYRKYVANQVLEIQGDKFYNDFINGFFFRSCAKGYVSKETRAPTDFKSKVEGFYDFNPDLWFDNKDPANPTKFKPENKHDSYGNFFKVRQPIKIVDALTADGVGPALDPRNPASYTTAGHLWPASVANADGQINYYTGIYDTATTDATCRNNYILTNEEKMVCCLFHYAAMRNQELLSGNLAARLTNPTRPLESLDFDSANLVLFGNGTDAGLNGGAAASDLGGQNAPINKAIQLLYNSKSLGFHLTHGPIGGHAVSSTLLVAGGTQDVQMITGYSCGVRQGANIFVSSGNAAPTVFSTGANATGNAESVQLFTAAVGRRPTIIEITTAFSKNRYEYIPISQIIKGGSSKYKKQKISKVISKKKLPKKEKKSNPVKKVKKYIQKGGGRANFFDITEATPNGVDISLSAKRREETLTKPIFENYRKAIKEYIKKFGKSASATKINDDIREKLYGIYHLGIFYHDNNKTLNFGGDGAGNTGPTNPLSIEQIGEIFLFCSVISNTIKLMIHFFNNIKACINHFINSDLQEIKKGIDKQLKVVNSTSISSFNASYFDKYIDGCTNLIKNIDELVKFLRNNTLCLGKPITNGDSVGVAAAGFTENEQNILNLFFGANVARQRDTKQAGGIGIGNWNLQTVYPTEFFTFNHSIIDFFSNNGKHDFTHLNTSKFHETLRRLTGGNKIVLNNGFIAQDPAQPNAFPKLEYSITKASFGGIPFTFQDDKSTHYSWMTYRLLLLWREKSNEKLSDEVVSEINQSLSQITSQDKNDIKKKVIETYKDVRPVLADPKIDLGSKNKLLQKIFFSFFENSNTIAKKIIDEHLTIEKKSKRINVRAKTSISNIVQRRHLGPLESGRVLIPDEIKIQQEMRKFSYKVDCLINLLHVILIAKTHPTLKNYIIFMYSISRLRNFVYRLYYLNKTYYTENEQAKKKLLEDSGFNLSKNSKQQNTKKTFETFNKLNSLQLKDQNSGSEDWWIAMEKSFRDRTTEIHGIYYRLYTYVLMDGEIYLVDIFSMAKSTHSVKSYTEILKKDVVNYRDHSGDEIYSPENMFIKPITDLSRDTTYRKLLNGELHYEYTKTGSRDKKKKILEPLFIQGSTVNQLHDIVKDNYYVPAARGRPDTFVSSRNPETSFQLYKIQKHFILHASAFRSWAYNLLFSMPTRIDVDDSFFKLHIQTPINTIPSLARSQLEPSLKHISYMNQRDPVIEFKSKVKVSNNSKLMLGNNINNKQIESFTKYISREQLILLGLVFGDTLN